MLDASDGDDRRILLSNQLSSLGLASPPDDLTLRFTGPRVVLASSFAVTEAAAVTIGALSAAVASLAQRIAARTGDEGPSTVVVDTVEASLAFQSERHLDVDADNQSSLLDELSGHYATSDGHVQFHTNFPHHRSALLEVTDCPSDATRDRVAAVVAGNDRFHWETEVSAAGGIAAAVRTMAEWLDHPHADHIEGRPPLEVVDLDDGTTGADRHRASAELLDAATADRPLGGLKVLDLTRVIAGPVCTRSLAAYGADVLRIGAPDVPVVEALLPDSTLGKRFAHIDLAQGRGLSHLLDLVGEADVLVTGYRPGTLADRGLTDESLLERNPNLIIAELNAFGADGPWGGRRGFDSITQSATGVVSEETEAFAAAGSEGDGLRPLPCQALDHGTGYLLAQGVVAALNRRLDGAGPQRVTASLLTTRNWLVSLGRTDPTEGSGLDRDRLADLLETRQSPYGPIRHAPHPGRIEGVAARWTTGPAKPGADTATWL